MMSLFTFTQSDSFGEFRRRAKKGIPVRFINWYTPSRKTQI